MYKYTGKNGINVNWVLRVMSSKVSKARQNIFPVSLKFSWCYSKVHCVFPEKVKTKLSYFPVPWPSWNGVRWREVFPLELPPIVRVKGSVPT